MSDEQEHVEGEEAAKNFTRLVKRVISVPKSEIDKRAEEWRTTRETDKRESAE